LRAVVGGQCGVPTNIAALKTFRRLITDYWHHVLCRRSQQEYVPWQRMERIRNRWLPLVRICHPILPAATASLLRQEPDEAIPQVRICAGGAEQSASLPRPRLALSEN
jgi:hypothetical protein